MNPTDDLRATWPEILAGAVLLSVLMGYWAANPWGFALPPECAAATSTTTQHSTTRPHSATAQCKGLRA